MENDTTLDLLLDALAVSYPNDACRPGVLVSKLNKSNRKYYASILRFPAGRNDKLVVARASSDTKEETIKTLAESWLKSTISKSPIDTLRDHLDYSESLYYSESVDSNSDSSDDIDEDYDWPASEY